ncbi:WAP-type 'four-disulfide core [Trichinella nativa]|uniref:WAP-type 'four-disulfide core n=1 Tax=Trichinella nativa TaxID=6335 RepID=A0A1Y3EUG5_9BILA|nr:WAP-type 'four-disulfide core [Trichinella nativa]
MFFAMLHIVASNSGLTCRVGVWGTFPLLKMKMIMNTLTNVVANGKFDKAGLCPLPPGPTVSNAINYCNQDDDCKDAMKCCPTILGRRCMNPDSKRKKKDSNDDGKPGSCPQLIVPSGYAIGKDDECRGDLQCSGKRKCCQTLAGKRCLLPV